MSDYEGGQRRSYGRNLDDYVDVAARIAEFRVKYPEGTLQPADPAKPFEVVVIGDKTYIAYTAAAYRTPDDPRPGIGVAWEHFPGKTPYTRDSELMNAETSAWGRAIIAVGAADAKKGIATKEEIRNRRAEQEAPPSSSAAGTSVGGTTKPGPVTAEVTATRDEMMLRLESLAQENNTTVLALTRRWATANRKNVTDATDEELASLIATLAVTA